MPSSEKKIKKLVSGTGVIAVGSVVGIMLQFSCGLLVVNTIKPEEYGLYTLAFTIISIAVLLANFGMPEGLAQFTSRYRATLRYDNVWGCILIAAIISIVLSLLLSVSIWFFSDFIAGVFQKPELVYFLKFFVVLIPCMSFMMILLGVFRGLSIAWVQVIFESLSPRLIKLIGLLFVISMGCGLSGVLWVTVIPMILVFFALMLYAYKSIPRVIPYEKPALGVTSKLVRFSLPLYGNRIISLVSIHASTLILGYYVASDMVALHRVTFTIVQFMEVPIVSMAFLYLPTATSLHADNNLNQISNLYKNGTKWITLITMPIFLFFLMDVEFMLTTLFGHAYLPAANALKILSIGFLIHTALGPNGMTLISLGRSKMVLIGSLLGAILSISLNFLLIPQWNIIGAVIAASIGMTVSNLFLSTMLYLKSGIQPFTLNYIKPFVAISLFVIVINYLFDIQPASSTIFHIILPCSLFVICVIAPFVTKSIDANDMVIISAIENKIFKRQFISAKLSKWYGLESVV